MRGALRAILAFAAICWVPWHVSRAAEAVEAPPSEMLKLRDPFRRPDIVSGDAIPRTELETFSVDQFRLVGVTTGPDRIRAMVSGPNDKTYFISQGTKIGLRRGFVRKITPESVSVREKIVNVLGQEEDVDSELRLPSTKTGN